MAFIYNLKTKLLHECRNADVAKWCKNRPEEYLVSDDKEKLVQVLALNNALESAEPAKQEKKKSPSQAGSPSTVPSQWATPMLPLIFVMTAVVTS